MPRLFAILALLAVPAAARADEAPVLVFLLVRRLAGGWVGLAAALVLVFDPFVLRMDGRVMIETVAGLAVVAGWLLMLWALERAPGKDRAPREWAAALAFGIALLCKAMTAAFTVATCFAAATAIVALTFRGNAQTAPSVHANAVASARERS